MAHDLTRNPLEPSLIYRMPLSMVTRLLASDLNPPHDTRHDTRLPVLTEVDGSMNPLEELDDTTKGL
jgi:hypothetical protein